MNAIEAAVAVVGAGACGVAALRWLRVAQREHYLAGSTTRFAARWWRCTPANTTLFSLGVVALLADFIWPLAGLVAAAVGLVGPLGLGVRGRTSPLAWTRRLRTLAVVSALAAAAVLLVGSVGDRLAATSAALALGAPVLIDFALLLLAPVERRLASRHVTRAAETLRRIDPKVVAITGSYGKTTTKQYARHLLSGRWRVLASPASFNNAAGLSLAINEHLAPGTEVFIAEMGTYGAGEIEAMTRWIKPDIGVITAIGPVHLERMKTLDGIVAAKEEILEPVDTAVLNVDAHGLASLADRTRLRGVTVLARRRNARATRWMSRATRDGGRLAIDAGTGRGASIESNAHPTNLACAIAITRPRSTCRGTRSSIASHRCLTPSIAKRSSLPRLVCSSSTTRSARTRRAPPHRSRCSPEPATLRRERVVVTPGMVELGRRAKRRRTSASPQPPRSSPTM